ncbi:MAG: Aldehyde dehydrogenase [Myxococcales bacterium]|nr:Aldehyde dehydrogenase [Myxococcales bacterium]
MSIAIPQTAAAHPTANDALARDLEVLAAHKQTWATLPVAQKIELLAAVKRETAKVAERWVAAAVANKGIPAESALAGEEWSSGPWALLYGLSQLVRTLGEIERHGRPRIPKGAVRRARNGQVIVDVFPSSLYDKLLLSGVSGEVWMEPDVTPENLDDHLASFYRTPNPVGKVALVLGAGNIASIAPLDVLYKLVAEGQVCMLKMNPVNEYVGPFLEEAFAPLVAAGFVRVVYGGGDVGAWLCEHPLVEEIHVTGSARTHDAIVFGSGPAGEARRKKDEPKNRRRVTSELGNVSPIVVVPGPWTAADVQFQSEQIATMKMHNAGFNCIAGQVLVLPAAWNQSQPLVDAVKATLRALPNRLAYYPGAAERQKSAHAAHPNAELLDEAAGGVPRTLISGVPSQGDQHCFREEAFGGVLSETRLPGEDARSFLENAVAFCNDRLWGTLGANLLIHPATIKELGDAFDDALAELRYGCIAINTWTGVGFLLAQTTWGAFPGHARNDIQSGDGVVHNSRLFDRPQKSVIRAPFYPFPRGVAHGQAAILPKPPWFITNKRAHETTRKLTFFEAAPSPLKLPSIFMSALLG